MKKIDEAIAKMTKECDGKDYLIPFEEHLTKICVRTYADKVAEGRCAILFIRRTDAPDEPYFTLELSPELKIVQCRGKYNCSYPDEVAEFLKNWRADVLEKLKHKRKGEAASAA